MKLHRIFAAVVAGLVLTSCGDEFLTSHATHQGEAGAEATEGAILSYLTATYQPLLMDSYADYNYNHIDRKTGLPVGTLRIPSFLVHNDKHEVGSRVILKDALVSFKRELMTLLKENPYVFDYLPIDSVDDIDEIISENTYDVIILEYYPYNIEDSGFSFFKGTE